MMPPNPTQPAAPEASESEKGFLGRTGQRQQPLASLHLLAVPCSYANATINLVCLPLSLPAVRGWPGQPESLSLSHCTWATGQQPLRASSLVLPLLGTCKASLGLADRPRPSA